MPQCFVRYGIQKLGVLPEYLHTWLEAELREVELSTHPPTRLAEVKTLMFSVSKKVQRKKEILRPETDLEKSAGV